jgi:peptidoglycan/xylan/chitin deacetylase (PgdA/CDA1 family)
MDRKSKKFSFNKFVILSILVIGLSVLVYFLSKTISFNKTSTLVNLQVTEYKDPDALKKVMDELEKRGIDKATLFIGGDFAQNNCPLVKEYDQKGYEIALFGYALDKDGNFVQLATLPKGEMVTNITKSKKQLETCLGHPVSGFRAQRFSQNDNVNQAVSDLGFKWNGSFVAGSSFLEENKEGYVPYKSQKFGFDVVTMIGAEVQSGRISALCDAALDSVVDSPKGWADTVRGYFQKYSREKLPFLTEFHPYLLVTDNSWWSEFSSLLDWLKDQNPTFLTTLDLIDKCNPAFCTE